MLNISKQILFKTEKDRYIPGKMLARSRTGPAGERARARVFVVAGLAV